MKNQLAAPGINFTGTEISYTAVPGGKDYFIWVTSGPDLVCRSTRVPTPPSGGVETVDLSQLQWEPGRKIIPGKYTIHAKAEGGPNDEAGQSAQEIDLNLKPAEIVELKTQIQVNTMAQTTRELRKVLTGLSVTDAEVQNLQKGQTITNAEVQKLQQKLAGLETAIAGAASKTALDALATKVDSLEKEIGQKIAELNQSLVDTGKANTDALKGAEKRIVAKIATLEGHKHDFPTPPPIPDEILNRLKALETKTPPPVPPTPTTPPQPVPAPQPVPVPPQSGQPVQSTKESWWQAQTGLLALLLGVGLLALLGLYALIWSAKGQNMTPAAVTQPAAPAPTIPTSADSRAELEKLRQAVLDIDRTNALAIADLKTALVNAKRGPEPTLSPATNSGNVGMMLLPSAFNGGSNNINIITIGDGNEVKVGWPKNNHGQPIINNIATNVSVTITQQFIVPVPQVVIQQPERTCMMIPTIRIPYWSAGPLGGQDNIPAKYILPNAEGFFSTEPHTGYRYSTRVFGPN